MKKIALFVIAVTAGFAWRQLDGGDWRSKVDPILMERAALAPMVDFIVVMKDQADVSKSRILTSKEDKGRYVYNQLVTFAKIHQAPLIQVLQQRNIQYHSFFIVNALYIKGDIEVIRLLAERNEVAQLIDNSRIRVEEPMPGESTLELRNTIEWGIERINADDVWNLGYTGQNVVVGGADTGYEWDHPVIKEKYRGWNGTAVDHNYNWHDGIHTLNPLNGDTTSNPMNNPCGLSSLVPCDDHNHGTHTMGTMVGDDGQGNQVGVAPGARWMACRNMERGWGSPASYIECFEWFIAPTDLNNANPDPSKSPHVINNSWGCPPEEGCNPSNFAVMNTVVNNLKAAGIVVVVSAGNDGSSCSSVRNPAAMFENSFSVGASRSTDTIAGFSSRGPVMVDSSGRLKPNVVAPGVGVRSSIRGGQFATWNGTSMAGPHVAGLVALLISANPELAGQVETIETIIEQTAMPMQSNQDCGDVSGLQIPNNTYGYGRVDALAAVQMALEMVTPVSQPAVAHLLHIFPNPVSNLLTIEWTQGNGPIEFDLYNTALQNVGNWHWTDVQPNKQTVNVSRLPAGVYFYRWHSAEGVQTGKVVVE